MKQWYEKLFENYGQKYDNESFAQGTIGECDFIEKEINFDKSLKILDIGWEPEGIPLNYQNEGIPLPVPIYQIRSLKEQGEKAENNNLKIDFVKSDARDLPFNNEFDVAIMLCEGAFPLMETDEMNFEILRNATKSLKKHGKIIFTTLNGLFPLYHSVEEFCASTVEDGNATYRSNTFDLMTFRDHNITEVEDDSGKKLVLECNERYYVPSEISWLLKTLGFMQIGIFGAKLGAFSRNDKLTTEDFEMLVVAEKIKLNFDFMKTLEESVVTAMDGSDTELFAFLPYILQDVWEIGAEPGVIINLIRKNKDNYPTLKILDLGCGKGAVSIRVAKEFKCTCLGIDAIKEFINEANRKAQEYGVENLCTFMVDDIRERVKGLGQFDVIILGAIGPVFGDYSSTLSTLSKCLNTDGIIIIDDGYIADDSSFSHPIIQKQETILRQIKDSGMKITDEVIIEKDDIEESDDYIFYYLKKRCHELIKKHPEKSHLFEDYIKRQVEENDVLETKVVCSTMVIKK